MIEVTLYTRQNCPLCDEAKAMILSLESEIPLILKEIDIDFDTALKKKYGDLIPVIRVGPYMIKAPIELTDLRISLLAAQQREQQIAEIKAEIASGKFTADVPFTKIDRFTLWLTRKWVMVFTIFTLIYVGLPFLAPVLMQSGAQAPAALIYRVYGAVCHEFAFRSWFLFGEQPFYPRQEAGISGYITYQDATQLPGDDLWAAREYVGNNRVGFKVALCQRDIGIYVGILMFGIIFAITGHRIKGIPWYFWIIFGVLPIALDGMSQLLSQPPLTILAYRESTPLLRTITGWLFGFVTAWYGYPIAEASMRDSQEYLMAKVKRIESRNAV
jgi:uncharacterized membrane protein